jgi:uncharacterized membrane protein
MKAKDFFNKISYLQYPLVFVALSFYGFFLVSLVKNEIEWSLLNNMLVFMGLAISFSTLQDTTKTQNKFSQKIWESPAKGKMFLILLSFSIVIFLVLGLIGFLKSTENVHKEISFGLIVLGIGLVGLLNAAMQMFENHRLDKNPPKPEESLSTE